MHQQDFAQQEQKKYQLAYDSGVYNADNCCGIWHINTLQNQFNPQPNQTLVDIGCGTGIATAAIRDQLSLDVVGWDLVPNGLCVSIPFELVNIWQSVPDQKFDYVFCCDVLEHIPTELIDIAIENCWKVCQKGCVLAISSREDTAGQALGEVMHLTVQNLDWWLSKLDKYFFTMTATEGQGLIVYTGIPRGVLKN